jgi:hypothetical protein
MLLPTEKKKYGAAVMTQEASAAGDSIKNGNSIVPESARPKIL